MRKFALFLAAASGWSGLSAPAIAAAPSAAAVYEAGRCMVQRDRRAAASLILALPLDGGVADLSSLRSGGARVCVAAAEGASTMLVRGAIAQALFIRDFRRFGREPNMRTAFVNLNLPIEASPSGPRTVELYRWADCVVRNDSAGIERLLLSPVGAAGEAGAIAALQTYMSACMRAGTRLTVRASEVRSLFAQSAYFTMYRYWTGELGSAGSRGGN